MGLIVENADAGLQLLPGRILPYARDCETAKLYERPSTESRWETSSIWGIDLFDLDLRIR